MSSRVVESPKKRFSLRKTLSKRFSSHRTDRRKIEPLPDEQPVLVLRVQVLACKNIAAADWNGKSDPYVVATFHRQRQKTPAIQKTLNPTWNAKDATFDFPVYQSVAERLGTLLELVIWDKDVLSKDYLAELPLACSDWFAHNGGAAAYDFAGAKNKSFWLDLQSSKSSKEAKGSIHIKLGFVAPSGAKGVDFASLYALLVKASHGDIFSAPATHGIGTFGESGVGHLNEDSSDDDDDADDASAKTLVKSLPSFRLNWQGTKINYSFSQHKDIAGILLLEIKSAADLPKQKDMGKSGFECDPCAVIAFGKRTARTRVIRHTLAPEWNERLILVVPPDGTRAAVALSVLNWDTIAGEATVGETTLDIADVVASAPKPDARTGLYPPEAGLGADMREFRLPLAVPLDAGLDTKAAPVLVVSAKYEHHAAFRQRFWRANLHDFDKDNSGSFSRKELAAFLRDLGIHLEAPKIDEIFSKAGRNAHDDQLTIDEAVAALESLIGVPPAAPTEAKEPPAKTKEAEEPAPPAEEPASPAPAPVAMSPIGVEEPTTAGASNELFDSEPEDVGGIDEKLQDASWIDVKSGKPVPEPEEEHRAEVAEVVPPTTVAPPVSVVEAVKEKEEPVVVAEPEPTPLPTPQPEPERSAAPVLEAPPAEKPARAEKAKKKTKAATEEKPKPAAVPARREVNAAEAERAAAYAALVLADAGVEITAEHIVSLLNAAGIELEVFWASVFERALAGKDVKTMLLSVGAGGGAAAGASPLQTSTGVIANGGGEVEQGGKTEEPAAEESDDDMGFGLFD